MLSVSHWCVCVCVCMFVLFLLGFLRVFCANSFFVSFYNLWGGWEGFCFFVLFLRSVVCRDMVFDYLVLQTQEHLSINMAVLATRYIY